MLQDNWERENQNYSAVYYFVPTLCLTLWENTKVYEVFNLVRQVRCTNLKQLENRMIQFNKQLLRANLARDTVIGSRERAGAGLKNKQ